MRAKQGKGKEPGAWAYTLHRTCFDFLPRKGQGQYRIHPYMRRTPSFAAQFWDKKVRLFIAGGYGHNKNKRCGKISLVDGKLGTLKLLL